VGERTESEQEKKRGSADQKQGWGELMGGGVQGELKKTNCSAMVAGKQKPFIMTKPK